MKESKPLLILVFIFQVLVVFAQDTTTIELLPVEIRSQKSYSPAKIALGRSQFLSAPASFDDPSRVLMKYPGFSVSNDQNNAIIYEGMPSHYSTWSLYGAQIASPNHLSNAGTANDRPSRTAGGVNMFSGQVIGELNYRTGAEGPAHGIGGVADISLRSPYQNTVTANLSLIGLEAGIDRVFDEGQSSLMGNYRYSTVGLLSQLGADLGDEIITYQDAVAEYKRNWNDLEVRLTAVYGKSSNDHEASALQGDVDAEFKNIQNIEFGATNKALAISAKSSNYEMSVAYSSRKTDRVNNFIFDDRAEVILSNVDENILSLYTKRDWIHRNNKIVLSLNLNRFDQRIVDLNSRDYDLVTEEYDRKIFFKDNYFEIRPKLLIDWDITANHKLIFGSSSYFNTLIDEQFLLPFISYHTKVKSINTIVSIQNDRQSVASEVLGMQGLDQYGSYSNSALNSMNSWSAKLDINSSHHGVVFFSNFIFDTPRSIVPSPFEMRENFGIDEIGNLPISRYSASNDVVTFGLKAYTKFDLSGYTIHANYTLMDSQMDEQPGSKVPLDMNNIFNVGIDRSFRFSDKKSLRVTSSFHFRNGFQRLNIDVDESRSRLQTVYSGLGIGTLNNYQRLDLRISYIKKGKWKNVISLDIQNVMNRQNDAYYYFDPLLDEVQLQKQLGLIPILSWRIVI